MNNTPKENKINNESGGTIRLPIDTPFEKLPPIFQNWNKSTLTIELTQKQLDDLTEETNVKILHHFGFLNRYNNFRFNNFDLTIILSPCKHDDPSLLEECDDDPTFIHCKKCGKDLFAP